jgi:hypothetical protein
MPHNFHNTSWRCLSGLAAAFILALTPRADAAHTELIWDPSPSSNIAGYKVHVGSQRGSYGRTIDVGRTTTAIVDELATGQTYFFSVTAYDGTGAESEPSNEASTRIVNQAPAIAITSPAPYSSVAPGHTVTVVASVADQDSTIAKVEFFEGPWKIGEDTAAPYSTEWTPEGKNTYQITAVATDADGATTTSAAVTIKEKVATNRSEQGSYIGRISGAEGDISKSGILSMTQTSLGGFTGKLVMGGVKQNFKGQFDANGTATVALAAGHALSLQLDSFSAPTSMTGTVSQGGSEVAEIVAERQSIGGPRNSPYAGKWTMLLTPPSGEEAAASALKGVGYAAVKVNTLGVAKLTGALPDGTRVSYGGPIWSTGAWPIHFATKGRSGLVDGVPTFVAQTSDTHVLEGVVEWLRADRSAKLPLTVGGEPYAKPAGKRPVAASGSASTTTISLEGGGLTSPILQTVTASASGAFLLQNVGPQKLSVRVNSGNGTFSGSFLDLTAGEKRKFAGALLQTQSAGAGLFVVQDGSGLVVLEIGE